MTRRIWIATAPPGVWSSGPAVINDEYRGDGGTLPDPLVQYAEMGWKIEGPFDVNVFARDHGGTPGTQGWPVAPLPPL